MPEAQVRLAYALTAVSRTQRCVLLPCDPDSQQPLDESSVKRMRGRLHPLDVAIVQEICNGAVFGQLGDTELARLLPLLAQRRTQLAGARLRMTDEPLAVRVRVSQTAGGMPQLMLGLASTEDDAWYALADGRLVAGPQAFFLEGHRAHPIQSPAPWLLAQWAQDAQIRLRPDQLTPAGRDTLIRDFTAAGVPPEDLEALSVRRGPPLKYLLRLLPLIDTSGTTPQVRAEAIARYAFGDVVLEGQRGANYADVAVQTDDGGLNERDLLAEEEARQVLRQAGLRFDKTSNAFMAQDEAALAILDPRRRILPSPWQIERNGQTFKFHRDLALHTQVQMVEEQSLLDLRVKVQAVDDDATIAALVDMKDLLAWLPTGQRYVRLADGSYAAPSARFRQSLRILGDLGADGDRALISPLCIGLLRAMGDASSLTAADEATRNWLEELSQASGPRSVETPPELQATLRDYQRRGVDWLMMLHRHRLTGILADDMGLGKTLQTLALLLLVRNLSGKIPSLVVAPTSVVPVWRDEAERFAPDLKVVLWCGPPQVRHTLDLKDADLVVTTYGILRRDAERFAEQPFRYVILDEAQSAKNAASHNARAIRRLKSERRLALSGTPLENRPEELWSVFDFLAPGFLGSLRQFRKRYAQPISRNDTDALGLLRMRIAPLMLRRLKNEVAQELPDKVESVVHCDMGPAQRALYDHIAGELRESIQSKIAKVGIERAQLDILAALTRLRQVCCDPALLPAPGGAKVPPSAKLELFEELMREALASNRCVVVFSQFVQMQTRLIEVIKRLGVDPLWLHGGSVGRDKIVANFQDPKGPPVIVVSLRAGGTGVTLTRADTVMHYDPWWNPAVERQATDRAHRLGQKNTVTVYKLVCTRSIEEKVVQLAQHKEALARDLLGSEGGAQSKRITQDDVMALLTP